MCRWTYYLLYAPLAENTLLLPNRPRVNVPPRCASKGLQLVPLFSANNRPKASSHPLSLSLLCQPTWTRLSTFDFSVIFKNIEVSVGASISLNFDCLSILNRLSFFLFFFFLKINVDVSVIAIISFENAFFYFDLILFFCSFFYYLDVSLGATISLIFYCFSILIWVSKIRFFVFFLSWS